MQGYIISDHYDRYPRVRCGRWAAGCATARCATRETVVDGVESAPRAFIGLLEGENVGKMLVRVGPDP